MNPLISIIIPTYNHANFLNRCLNSIAAQTYTNWEAIVIDNFSVDETNSVIEKFSNYNINYFKLKNNGIIAVSRNYGILKSKGSLIAFLDSDDWWVPEKLEYSIKHINNGYDLVYHSLTRVVNYENHSIFKCRKLYNPIFLDLILNGNTIINSSVVIKKSLLLESGPLDENKEIIAAEDYDLWTRVSLITDKFYMIPENLGFYWYGGDNMSKKTNYGDKFRYIIKKHKKRISKKNLIKAYGFECYVEGLNSLIHKRKKESLKFFIKSTINATLKIRFKSFYRILTIPFK